MRRPTRLKPIPTLPLPLVSAPILGFLFLRSWIRTRKLGPLAVLLGLCAVQTLITSLAQHYRVPIMALVQPVTASLIPQMAWIAFQTTAIRQPRRADLANLAAPAAAVLAIATFPPILDVLIPGLFLGYGAAILLRLRSGADRLPHLWLEAAGLPDRTWRIIAIVLMTSALSDVHIVAAHLVGASHLKPWIMSFYTVANLLTIGALSLSEPVNSFCADSEEEPAEVSEFDEQIMARLTRPMTEKQLYLDPDLTLAKLSRKLRIPAKQLSFAINRTTGETVSRFVNNARIAAEKEILREGAPVTRAMPSSGFNTKSDFNREIGA